MPYLFDNCQGKWKLANGVWTDGSSNGYTLTPSASAPTAITGHGGTASAATKFVRASSQYLTISDASAPALDITGSLSIAAWIYLNAIGTNYYMIASKLSASGQYAYDFFVTPSGNLRCRLSSNGTALTTVTGSTVLTAATWYPVGMVSNGTDIRLYTLATLDNTPVAYSSGIFNSNAGFYIGMAADGVNHGFDGYIADAGIWNRALTAAEMTALSNLRDSFVLNGAVSGILKDKNGTIINASTYNVRLNVYQKNNITGAPIKTALINAANGAWSIGGLTAGQKYATSFEFEGAYAPTSETDIAGFEFQTAV